MYYNKEEEKKIIIDFSETVNKMYPDFEDISFKKMESVKAGCVMHKGPYSTIGKAYAYIMKWIEENEYVRLSKRKLYRWYPEQGK